MSNIIGKGNVTVSLSNGSALKLKDVGHVSKLKKNLIYIGQLADVWMKTTLDGDSYKIKKGAMIKAHGKKECTLDMNSGSTTSISVASSDVDAGMWHRQLG